MSVTFLKSLLSHFNVTHKEIKYVYISPELADVYFFFFFVVFLNIRPQTEIFLIAVEKVWVLELCIDWVKILVIPLHVCVQEQVTYFL